MADPTLKRRRYLVDYEARHDGAIGDFEATRVQVEGCSSAEEAIAQAREHLRWQGLETRSPVRVQRKSGSSWKAVPYIPWRDARNGQAAGLREALLDD